MKFKVGDLVRFNWNKFNNDIFNYLNKTDMQHRAAQEVNKFEIKMPEKLFICYRRDHETLLGIVLNIDQKEEKVKIYWIALKININCYVKFVDKVY